MFIKKTSIWVLKNQRHTDTKINYNPNKTTEKGVLIYVNKNHR